MPNNNAVSTNEIMEFLKEHVVVKEDIKDMVVKEDIADMATKQDITVAIGALRSNMIDHVDRKTNTVLGEVGKVRFDLNEVRTGLGQQIKDVRQEVKDVRQEVKDVRQDLGQTKREILLAMKGEHERDRAWKEKVTEVLKRSKLVQDDELIVLQQFAV